MILVRLQKIISRGGVVSRRKAEGLIRCGLVTVNGQVIREMGVKADPKKDHIKVEGRLIHGEQPMTYLILHKPKGVITTLSDPQGRPTVKDFLSGIKIKVYPVGRLDYHSEGLVFLTNDGEMAHALIHPRYQVPRTYQVKVKGSLSEDLLSRLRRGVFLPTHRRASCRVESLRRTVANSWLEVTLYEGQKRQIRRMMDVIGHPVLKLKRIRLATLELGDLQPGRYRYLFPEEIKSLRACIQRFQFKVNAKEELSYNLAVRHA